MGLQQAKRPGLKPNHSTGGWVPVRLGSRVEEFW